MQLVARGRISELAPMSRVGGPRPSMAGADASGPRAALASAPRVGPTGPGGALGTSQGGSHGGIASLVGASVGNVLRAAPPWMSRKVLAIAASALGAILLVLVGVIVASSLHGDTTAPATTGSAGPATVAPPPPRPPDPKTDEVVSEAQLKIDKGDFATAIDELTGVEAKAPDRADVHMLLERAYTGVRNAQGAMKEADLWLTADPSSVADIHLQEDIRNAALMKDAQDEAFTLLDSKMGTRGIDILYDIAYLGSGRMYPQAAARARKSLETAEVRKRASAPLAVLLQFKDAKTCEQKHALLEAVRDKADARVLSVLQPYEASRGCGFLGRSDCYPCMHHDHLLEDAKQQVTERAARP
jgi:serine/threonine-protein kinase